MTAATLTSSIFSVEVASAPFVISLATVIEVTNRTIIEVSTSLLCHVLVTVMTIWSRGAVSIVLLIVASLIVVEVFAAIHVLMVNSLITVLSMIVVVVVSTMILLMIATWSGGTASVALVTTRLVSLGPVKATSSRWLLVS